jgi:signal peptidase I
VFRYPKNPREYFIKRIIGLPGEKVEISDGKLFIYNEQHPDGWELSEKYLDPNAKLIGSKIVQLAEDEYYLLGDNRQESLDSRFFGPVKRKLIIGRVFFRGWPLNRVGFFLEAPTYN